MSNIALDQIVAGLNREQCLKILSDPKIDPGALQRALATVVQAGGLGTTPATVPAIATRPTGAPLPAKSTAKPTTKKAPKANGSGIDFMAAVKAAAGTGVGFSTSDLAAGLKVDSRDPSLRNAIKAACAAGIIHAAGSTKAMRYGATPAIAEAAVAATKAPATA